MSLPRTIGAASTMFSMRESLWSSLRGIFAASAVAPHEEKTMDPRDCCGGDRDDPRIPAAGDSRMY